MTLNEYAERVLFSTSLEEKLLITPASQIDSDELVSPSIQLPPVPVRPDELRFRQRNSSESGKNELPARAALVDEHNRGKLLHFFANHELLAAELMALALLKFPEAPRSFRVGLLQTLREEQRHTRWYVERMKQCGVTFGEFPLNRFFWDAVAPMETPLDYVSRLSLTFEQANLDYSRHFAGILREAGDTTSAKILEKIYQDEIGHVGYGLNWFRKWKDSGDSDWEAFEKVLYFPLSPSRAKGNSDVRFNNEGRLAAGIDSDFVRNLALFERSKGRTPNIFFFNPEAEDHVAAAKEGGEHKSTGKVRSLIRDLEILTMFLARRDDVVLVEKMPSLDHKEFLAKAGFILPEFQKLDANRRVEKSSLLFKRQLRGVKPWARCPFAEDRLRGLSNGTIWRPEFTNLYSKIEQSARFGNWMALPDIEGLKVEKAAISSAGRGNRVHSMDEPCSIGNVNEGKPDTMVEPWVNRVFDYSVQFEYDGERLQNLGMIQQIIGPTGQYRGSYWQPKFLSGIDDEISRVMANDVMPAFATESSLCKELTRWLDESEFTGALGIDGFVFRMPDGSLKARYICEINPRYTMGRVALELSRFVSPGRGLRFSLGKAEVGDESEFEIDRNGKLTSGSLILNEIDATTVFAAKLEII